MMVRIGQLFVLVFLRIGSPELMADERRVSDLKSDERIVFITTDAWYSADEAVWNVPVHAWVHEYERAALRKAALAAGLIAL